MLCDSIPTLLQEVIRWLFRWTTTPNHSKKILANIVNNEEAGFTFIDSDGKMSSEYRSAIRGILLDFMRDTNVTYLTVAHDEDFAQGCCELAIKWGCPVDIVQSCKFQLDLHVAATIVTTTYAHLESVSTRQYICLYVICLLFFDDLTRTDASMVREFHSRFACGKPQMHPLLDLFADMLKRSYDHFLPACANLVVSSSLDFVAGLIIDHDFQSMQVNKNAASYPRWVRTVMGAAVAFVVFAFPPDIPLASYVQVVPDMVDNINDVNDIYSFYKEESANENTNHISLLAQISGKTKLQCMKDLATYTVNSVRRCRTVLGAHPRALEIYTNQILQGYITFHTLADKRYKLDELDLASLVDQGDFGRRHSVP